MTTRNKRKLAALIKEKCEENPRSNMAQNSGAPRSQEDYITQVSEEIEGRVTKRLSKEFSRTENRILGALARLDDFLMNPLLPGHSGTTPEPTRNTSHNNQGTNEDGSQNDPHPEAGHFHGQTTRNVSLEEDHDIRDSSFLQNLSFSIACYTEELSKGNKRSQKSTQMKRENQLFPTFSICNIFKNSLSTFFLLQLF